MHCTLFCAVDLINSIILCYDISIIVIIIIIAQPNQMDKVLMVLLSNYFASATHTICMKTIWKWIVFVKMKSKINICVLHSTIKISYGFRHYTSFCFVNFSTSTIDSIRFEYEQFFSKSTKFIYQPNKI